MNTATKPLVYVDDRTGLGRMIEALERSTEVAIDTEANSMFAYRERLCLVQLSTRTRDYVVDPLAVDVAPLGVILADPGILKVLHGAEFDVLLLKRECGFEIASLFDTRVAASSLGFEAPGLAAVLRDWLGVELDKRFQRSDWGKRPLSDGQIEYARSDTTHLLELARLLRAELRAKGSPHVEEVAAECRRLQTLEPEVRPLDAAELLRVKGAGCLDARGRRALEQLNRVRHQLAEARDLPPFKVFGNDVLLELARHRPRGLEEISKHRLLSEKQLQRVGTAVVDALRRARRLGPLDGVAQRADREQSLDRSEAARYERLRTWRKQVAERRRTDPSLILSKFQMLALATARPTPRTLDGLRGLGVVETWRTAFYGSELLEQLADA
ncbi:MAG: HRDC domain-containing protein [Planctomycetes bacterium]|nr:HRDC domain-containing protein [Planctomycetota bacterium]